MTGLAESIPTANPDEVEYWRTTGEKWRHYNRELDRLMTGITERLLQRAAPQRGEAVIDVGCGAGDSTLRLARAVGNGHVLGVDVSEVLLRLAEERARSAGIGNAEFLRADAQVHDFAAGAYDLAASRFGVMFFHDPAAAFRNLARALRRGGRFAFACWAPLDANPWFQLPRAAAVRHLGPAEPQPPHAPGPMAFADTAYVEGLLAAAGLQAVEVAAEGVELDGGDDLGELARLCCNLGPAARRIRETGASEETQAAIAAEVAEGFKPYVGANGIRIPATINLIAARRA